MTAIVCAPANLKGVLSAQRAARALADGVRAAGGDALEVPVADGGEGTAGILAAALGGSWVDADVHDPIGRPLKAAFAVLDDGTVVIEAAAAAGLSLVEEHERDPLGLSTQGLGELLLAAITVRPARILVCLGGTATVDGGRGMRAVVGCELDPYALVVACDVSNPLLGLRGAARAFGPQKGATREAVEELEARNAADVDLQAFAGLPGAGSAGGLGAAFASLGGQLCAGADLVLKALRFSDSLRDAALVITGEGTVDHTTFEGKAPLAVLEAARRMSVPAILFGGVVTVRPPEVYVVELSGEPAAARADLFDVGYWAFAAPAYHVQS